MPDFKDITSLLNHLQSKVNSALKQEVAKETIKSMQEHIQHDVYDVYEPLHPENRRRYDGGLIDPDMIEVQVIGDSKISIENIAYDGDRNVPYIVERGEGYYKGASDVLTKGRKFVENTYEELSSTTRLQNALQEGLKKRGIRSK